MPQNPNASVDSITKAGKSRPPTRVWVALHVSLTPDPLHFTCAAPKGIDMVSPVHDRPVGAAPSSGHGMGALLRRRARLTVSSTAPQRRAYLHVDGDGLQCTGEEGGWPPCRTASSSETQRGSRNLGHLDRNLDHLGKNLNHLGRE